MKRTAPYSLALAYLQKLLIVFCFLGPVVGYGQVTITGGNGGTVLCADNEYETLTPIVISETAVGDFNVRLFTLDLLRLGLTNPAFQFEPNSGSVAFTGTGSISVVATMQVTATLVEIQIVEGDNANAG